MSNVTDVLERIATEVLGDVIKRVIEEVMGQPDDSAADRVAKVTIAAALHEAEIKLGRDALLRRCAELGDRAAEMAPVIDKDIAKLADADAKLAASGVLEEPNRDGEWKPGFPIK